MWRTPSPIRQLLLDIGLALKPLQAALHVQGRSNPSVYVYIMFLDISKVNMRTDHSLLNGCLADGSQDHVVDAS